MSGKAQKGQSCADVLCPQKLQPAGLKLVRVRMACGSQTNGKTLHTPAMTLFKNLLEHYMFSFKRKKNGVYPAGR